MARLAGVDIPNEKRIEIALTYIFGVGRTRAKETLAATGISPDIRVKDLTDEQLITLRDYLEANYKIEGTCVVKSMQIFVARFRSTATKASVTVRDFLCAVSAPRPMLVPARARSARSPERRRPPSSRWHDSGHGMISPHRPNVNNKVRY